MGHLYTGRVDARNLIRIILLKNQFQPKKEHGEMVTTGLFTYAVLSPINGYIGGGLYSRMGGETWIKVEILNF